MIAKNLFAVLGIGAGLVGIAGSAQAAPITSLFSTGSTVGEGAIDTHWVLGTNVGGYGPTLITATNGTYPLAGNWIPNDATSKWLVPNSTQTNHAPGAYNYSTTFSLNGFIPSTASLSFRYAVDNNMQNVLLNGVPLGFSYTSSLSSFSQFYTVNSGFVAGNNTLTFVIENGTGTTQNPVGLNVQISGAASVVPESSSVAFAGLALPFLIGVAARRKK